SLRGTVTLSLQTLFRSRRETREDHVGVPGRLVQVDVEAHHEVEPGERARQAVAVRRAEDRIAGDRDETADLALARRLDLLGEAGAGELAHDFGEAAHPARAASGLEALPAPGRPAGVCRARRGAREHRAARPVEVAGERVHHIDEPAGKRPELLLAGADAAVDRRRLRRRDLPGEAP